MKSFAQIPRPALIAALAFTLMQLPARADLYDIEIPSDLYGYLNQNDVPEFGGWACGPTAATNGFTYLENAYPQYYAGGLVPAQEQDLDQDGVVDFYDDMIATVQVLGSNDYMRTINLHATPRELYIWGQHRYVEDHVPGVTLYQAQSAAPWYYNPRPDWCAPEDPTWDFLYQSLLNGADVGFLVSWTGGGHYLSLNGFHWDDANANGFIEPEEDALIDFVDPWTGLPASIPIWQDGGQIRTSYAGSSRMMAAFAARPIPEPTSILPLLLGVLVYRRRIIRRSAG